MQISRLAKVPLRQLWAHEARDFTSWLAQDLDLLGEKLNIELTLLEQEASAGPFSADILAEDGSGSPVVIENQLECTDHNHLGKLITYMSNLGAKTAVWITSDPRPEHERAVHWLNEVLPADAAFYLLKVEAYRIDDSAPAPLFAVVAGPTAEAKQAGRQKKDLAERHYLRLEFWQQLLEQAKRKTRLHAKISPQTNNWISAGAGKSGVSYYYVIRMTDADVELYIDRENAEENKHIWDSLFAAKADIERVFGGPLEWLRQDDLRASRIVYKVSAGGLRDREHWATIQERMVDAMVRLERALKVHIQELK
jgi:hypothetical protein